MADDREVFKVRRDAGLAKRHETRERRAIRREVAEEIAQALESLHTKWASAEASLVSHYGRIQLDGRLHGLDKAIELVREIGSKEAT
jgi:hypothetical protein